MERFVHWKQNIDSDFQPWTFRALLGVIETGEFWLPETIPLIRGSDMCMEQGESVQYPRVFLGRLLKASSTVSTEPFGKVSFVLILNAYSHSYWFLESIMV